MAVARWRVPVDAGRTNRCRAMIDEQRDGDLGKGTPTPEPTVAGERLGPRVVWPRDREQAAVRLAASLTEAVADFLLDAEKLVSLRADKIRASTLEDLERQRANVESLIGLFADRLREHEESVSSLKAEVAGLRSRLDSHAEALRSLDAIQARNSIAFSQVLEVVRHLAAALENPPPALAQPKSSAASG